MTQSTTIVRLSRSIDCDGRRVDSIAFDGAPGSEAMPINECNGEYEIDALELLSVMARRTNLSRPAIEQLTPIDFMALTLAMFLPRRSAQVHSLTERRKAKGA
jgi:hypothetical protein